MSGAIRKYRVRMTTSYEIDIDVNVEEFDDPEQQARVAYDRAVERRDERPGPRSWQYHDQAFKIVGM